MTTRVGRTVSGDSEKPAVKFWQLKYLAFLATDAGKKKGLVAARLSRGWCVGSKEFKKEAHKEAAERGANLKRERFGGLEPEEMQSERVATWEERLQALAAIAKIDSKTLSPQKSHPDKALLAAALKRSTSVSKGWLSERLSMGQPGIRQSVCRRWLLTEAGQKTTDRLLSRVTGSG